MSSTLSVSKGCFVFCKKKVGKKSRSKSLKQSTLLCEDSWYVSYKNTWSWVEEKVEGLRSDIFSKLLEDLSLFVEAAYEPNSLELKMPVVPTAVLLTGINMPDHVSLFSTLTDCLHKKVTPHIAVLHARKCPTIRATIEQMTGQFMNEADDGGEESDESDSEKPPKIKKSKCNLLMFRFWYLEKYPSRKEVKFAEMKPENLEQENLFSKSPRKLRNERMLADEEDKCNSLQKSVTGLKQNSGISSSPQTPSKNIKSRKIDSEATPVKSPSSHLRTRECTDYVQEKRSPKKSLSSPKIQKYNSSPNKEPLQSTSLGSETNQCHFSKSPRKKSSDKLINRVETQLSSPGKSPRKRKLSSLEVTEFSPKKTKLNDTSPKIVGKKKSSMKTDKKNEGKKLIVIIPDFENFSSKVLQEFVVILKTCVPTLPIVLVMGVATSVSAVHQALPYQVTACLSMKTFCAPASVKLLNQVLDKILFSPQCPFRLGSKTFNFLMEVFLCYDLSVKGFVEGFKFCMMEHFCGQNWKSLCSVQDESNVKVRLNSEDLVILRNLPSFSRYINGLSEGKKEKLLTDDHYTKKEVKRLLNDLYQTLTVFHTALVCLNVLTNDLPKSPLGTQVRELYSMSVSSSVVKTSEFREAFQLLGFSSRDELLLRLQKMLDVLSGIEDPVLNSFQESLEEHKKKIEGAGVTILSPPASPAKVEVAGKMNRHAFKEKLLELSKKPKRVTQYEIFRQELLKYLSADAFPDLLLPPVTVPLAEVIFFDSLSSIKAHVVGAPRAAIHTALNNPHFYLECECCVLEEDKSSLLPGMPDLCTAYKLYRECGRYINMYDWLQAFNSVVTASTDEEEQGGVEPQVQARFTRAVAELQFMGFLKTSTRKVDHVTKLSFDGAV